jgi:hypothetical protein
MTSGGVNLYLHIKGVMQAMKGIRYNFKPSMRKILQTVGDMKIRNIYVCRRPLSSKFKTLINIVNMASFRKNNPQHDKLFHLFLILQLNDWSSVILEKNEDLNIDYYKPSEVDEVMFIKRDPDTTLSELLTNAIQIYGNNRIFNYDAFSNNCQRFVLDVLSANNIRITKEMNDFILQDVSKLVPQWGKKLAHLVTSAFNRVKMAIQGYGERTIVLTNNDMLDLLNITY